ncbi:MAG TPA: hypothetical protein VK020_14655 [Microlunatus sp.]|nr:hypothetical protein [Microlunatus sp.]
MGWLRRSAERLRRGARARGAGPVDDAVTRHLTEFVRSRRGVEAFIEPQTSVTRPSLLLVAYDGEWTRRTIPSPQWGHKFAESLQIPGYDAAVVGYPQRMRDYNSRMRRRPPT